MKEIISWFLGVTVSFLIIFSLIVTISSPAFAPTKQIKILGATDQEQSQLKDFGSYTVEYSTEADKVLAASYLVKNLTTQETFTKKYSQNPLPVASLTKLMTAWVTYKHGSFLDVHTVTADDLELVSPYLGLKVGDEVLVKDLVYALLVGSANDSAVTLGNYLENKTGLTMSALMNDEVTNLGLRNSRFENPIGFDSVSNYSSSEDIAILVSKLSEANMFSETKKLQSYSFTSLLGNQYKVSATNKLIANYPDLSAIKTGFTNTALGSMVTILSYNGNEYLIIVIGSPDREADTLTLRELIKSK